VSGLIRPQDPVVLGCDGVLSCPAPARGTRRDTSPDPASMLVTDRWRSFDLEAGGKASVQISRPRDLGPLILVIGVFLILLVVSLTLGSSTS
jgi:hypothetical protein